MIIAIQMETSLEIRHDQFQVDEEAVMSRNRDSLVEFLVQEIKDEFQLSRRSFVTKDSLFFHNVVRGGNVQVVESVFETLREHQMEDELNWILGIQPDMEVHTDHTSRFTTEENTEHGARIKRVGHVLMYLSYSVLFVLTTPVFYIIHSMLCHVYDFTKTQLSKNIKLMFVHSILSKNTQMIKLFKRFGCSLQDTDKHGNNVFHYLVAISVDQPEKAIRAYKDLCSCYVHVNTEICEVFMEQRNDSGSTALEDVAKYGSLTFLRYLLEEDEHLGKLLVHIGAGNIRIKSSRPTGFDIDTPVGSSQNINMPEAHLIRSNATDQTGAGTITTSPDDECTASKEFIEDPTLRIWEVDVSQYAQGDSLGRQSYLLQLITNHPVDQLPQSDVHYLHESRVLKAWMRSKRTKYLLLSMLSNLLCVAASVLILIDIIGHGGDRNTRPLAITMVNRLTDSIQNSNLSFHPNDTDSMITYLNHTLTLTKDYILQACNKPEAKQEVEKQSNELLAQIINYLDVKTRVFHLDIQLDFDDWLEMTIVGLLVLQVILDLWYRQAFLWCNYNWKAKSVRDGVIPVIRRWLPGSYADKQLMAFIYSIFTAIGILIWATERQVYMTPHYPGDGHEAFAWFNESIIEFQEAITRSADMENTISTLYVMCLLISFLHVIHILRLMPGINFFIITTKKMTKNLIEFAIVFFIVFFGFVSVFYMVMRDSVCLVNKMPEFASIQNSLYWTFSTIVAHNVPNFTQSIKSEIAYVMCTIFTVIILLNLIIALMTMTATDMRARPWRMVMCRMELWQEILGTEARSLMVWAPVRYMVSTIRSCTSSHYEDQQMAKTKKLVLKVVHLE